MARNSSSGWLLPRERERLESKRRKANEEPDLPVSPPPPSSATSPSLRSPPSTAPKPSSLSPDPQGTSSSSYPTTPTKSTYRTPEQTLQYLQSIANQFGAASTTPPLSTPLQPLTSPLTSPLATPITSPLTSPLSGTSPLASSLSSSQGPVMAPLTPLISLPPALQAASPQSQSRPTLVSPSSQNPLSRRAAPEYAVVLAECLRSGQTDVQSIYTKLRECYRTLDKTVAPEQAGKENEDDCEEQLMQEMIPLMWEIPLSPAASSRPQPTLRGVIPGNGELLASDCDVFIHCCNCYHKMGAGIAKTIRDTYPCVAEADEKSPKGTKRKLGHFTSALTPDGKTFINLYAQYRYGNDDGQRKLNYKALRLGLFRIAERLRNQKMYPKIGSYYMGCYHAGGDKEMVKRIFNDVFCDMPVYIYTTINFPPQQQSQEPYLNKHYDYNQNGPANTAAVQDASNFAQTNNAYGNNYAANQSNNFMNNYNNQNYNNFNNNYNNPAAYGNHYNNFNNPNNFNNFNANPNDPNSFNNNFNNPNNFTNNPNNFNTNNSNPNGATPNNFNNKNDPSLTNYNYSGTGYT